MLYYCYVGTCYPLYAHSCVRFLQCFTFSFYSFICAFFVFDLGTFVLLRVCVLCFFVGCNLLSVSAQSTVSYDRLRSDLV